MRVRHGRRVRTAGWAVAGAAVAVAVLAGCGGPGSPAPGASAEPTPTVTGAPAPVTSPASPTPNPAPTAAPVAGDVPVHGPTSITSPASGSTVGPQVEVTGTGSAFEGTLLWELVDPATGAVGPSGFTTAGQDDTFAFTETVPAGTWRLHVWDPGMGEGDGAADRRDEATVTFTVS